MLYWLLVPLKEYISFFNVFRYITVRTFLAASTALLLSLLLGPLLIRLLKKLQIGEEIRDVGPQSHLAKKGTPTMGGFLIIACTLVPTLLWADLTNTYVWLAVVTLVLFGALGFWDDYLQVKKKKPAGLIARTKFICQIILAGVAGIILLYLGSRGEFDLRLSVPFFTHFTPYLGFFYFPWIMFIITASSNAVNLADGLDGLAIGLALISVASFTAICYIAGDARWSTYLDIPRVELASELTIFLGAMAGACLGFLWYNCHPAEVFMGDTGSLALGGALGTVAILIKQELLLPIVGGIFVVETLSVILQMGSYKLRRGKRIFRMAPLHHHYELGGTAEPKVTVRFWIIGILLLLLGMSSLKLQ